MIFLIKKLLTTKGFKQIITDAVKQTQPPKGSNVLASAVYFYDHSRLYFAHKLRDSGILQIKGGRVEPLDVMEFMDIETVG